MPAAAGHGHRLGVRGNCYFALAPLALYSCLHATIHSTPEHPPLATELIALSVGSCVSAAVIVKFKVRIAVHGRSPSPLKAEEIPSAGSQQQRCLAATQGSWVRLPQMANPNSVCRLARRAAGVLVMAWWTTKLYQ
jgi:hypothetical protein